MTNKLKPIPSRDTKILTKQPKKKINTENSFRSQLCNNVKQNKRRKKQEKFMLTGSTIARKVQKPFLEFDKRQNTKESAELSETLGV